MAQASAEVQAKPVLGRLMQTILITGIAGFIGSNLADVLLEAGNPGYRVIGIDNLSCGVRKQIPADVEFYELDIRSGEIFPLFESADYVFHLAAKNCISDCQADPVETADINVTGTVNVFEAAARGGVKKVIYAESSAMYEACGTLPACEEDVQAESFYAVSKLATMHFASSFARFRSLRFTALRYFNVYGPRQDYRRTVPPVISAFIISHLREEPPVIYGSGYKRRDFVHVDDINDFHLRCMTDERTDSAVFNLGAGVNYSVLEINKMVSAILGSDTAPVFKPDMPGEAQENLADISRAKEIGWTPKIAINDGMRGMVDYIRQEISVGNIRRENGGAS